MSEIFHQPNIRLCEECLKENIVARLEHLRPIYQTATVVRLLPAAGEDEGSRCETCLVRKSLYLLSEAAQVGFGMFRTMPDRK